MMAGVIKGYRLGSRIPTKQKDGVEQAAVRCGEKVGR